MVKVVILGGGTGGTIVANRLARICREIDVTVVDSHGDHLFQPGFLHIPFEGERRPLVRDSRELLRPGVRLLVERVRSVDRERRRVTFESGGSLDYDFLVLATGSRLAHDGFPGAREAGHNFHCRRSALKLREALSSFQGGHIVVGAHSLPYKCPPSILEFTFLLLDELERRKLRSSTKVTFTYPIADVFPFPAVASRMRPLLEERGVEIQTAFTSPTVDPGKKRLSSAGREIPFDLLVMVPPHIGAPFLRDSGLAEAGGWVPTDPGSLRVSERVYALGDTTNLQRPKSGSVAHFQAPVVVENLRAEIDGRPPSARYHGEAQCFLETGRGRASLVKFDYEHPPEGRDPNRWNFWKKKIFEQLYFRLIRRA